MFFRLGLILPMVWIGYCQSYFANTILDNVAEITIGLRLRILSYVIYNYLIALCAMKTSNV